jgi:hypothetical protein
MVVAGHHVQTLAFGMCLSCDFAVWLGADTSCIFLCFVFVVSDLFSLSLLLPCVLLFVCCLFVAVPLLAHFKNTCSGFHIVMANVCAFFCVPLRQHRPPWPF